MEKEEKKKKLKFSIFEMLAFVVVIAILVVNILPSVTKSFGNESRKEFVTEVKGVYSAAKEQYEKDNLLIIEERSYSQVEADSLTCGKEIYKKLDISTRKDLVYFIKINKEGKVVKFVISNSKYSYSYDGEDLDIEKVELDKELKEETINISCTLLNGETN